MTVPATSQVAGPFNGNGVTTAFPFTFKTFNPAHLRVVRAVSGVETTLVLNSDYTVALNSNQDVSPGGTITFPISGSPLAIGSTLTVEGAVPLGQSTDLPDGGSFNASTVETALDVLALQNLQQQAQIDRALQLPVSAPAGVSGVLPPPVANQFIGWDAAATALRNVDPTTLATIVATSNWRTDVFNGTGAQVVFTLSADPGNVNNMDVSISGVTQVPVDDYTVSGTTLTFTSAPPAGTRNVMVRYGQSLPQDGALAVLANGAVSTQGAALVAYTANLAYSTTSVGGFLNNVHGRTAAEISAGVTPTNYSRPERDPRRYGGTLDGVASDQTALAAALNVADEVVGGSQGSQVVLPQGTARMTATLNIPNRVGIVGVNKRGSTLQAAPGFTGTYMLTANNGLISMFDNALEKCNLDCNDIAGLGAVLSDAWQEGGGMRSVLINKFRTYGVRFQNGYGGASNTLILDSEIFGSASGATAGIRVDTISAVGAFKLTVQNTTIAGGGALPSSLPRAIDVVNDSTVLINVHFEVCQTGVYLDGAGDHLLIHCDGAGASSLVDTLVTIASTFTGTLTMIGCKRNGATNFLIDNRVGGLGTITGYDIPVLTIGNNTQAIRSDNAASAWCVFDGTGANGTKVPSASYNVSNVNKTATGSYRVTLSRAMKSVNACAIGDCNLATAATHVRTVLVSSTTFDLFVYTNGVLTDSNEVKGLIFGG